MIGSVAARDASTGTFSVSRYAKLGRLPLALCGELLDFYVGRARGSNTNKPHRKQGAKTRRLPQSWQFGIIMIVWNPEVSKHFPTFWQGCEIKSGVWFWVISRNIGVNPKVPCPLGWLTHEVTGLVTEKKNIWR
jgi:hypothetical protein